MSKKVSNSHGAILENPTFIQLVKNLPPYDRTECFLPVHKSLPLVQMLSQIHPIQAPTLILRLILILHNSKTQFLPITPFLQIFQRKFCIGYLYLFLHECCMSRLSLRPRSGNSNKNWCGAQIMNLTTVPYSQSFCCLFPLRSKCCRRNYVTEERKMKQK